MISVPEKSRTDRDTLLAALRTVLDETTASAPAVDYKIRKDCPICRTFIKKDQVTHPGTVEILPQEGGWWQLMHTRCLRQMVVASYGAEVVIDISGPEPEKGE